MTASEHVAAAANRCVIRDRDENMMLDPDNAQRIYGEAHVVPALEAAH